MEMASIFIRAGLSMLENIKMGRKKEREKSITQMEVFLMKGSGRRAYLMAKAQLSIKMGAECRANFSRE